MSVAEVTVRMTQIQARFAAMSGVRPSATAAAGGSLADQASFDTLLDAQNAAITGGTSLTTDVSSASLLSPATTTTAPRAGSGGADGDDIAAWAQRFAGVPYVAGGRSPAGWDCAGFTQYVFKQYGVSIPEVSWQQINQGSKVTGLDAAQPGDLLFFHEPNGHNRDPVRGRGVNHVAIYVGNGKMVEAANPSKGTVVSAVDTKHLIEIRRVLPTGDGIARSPEQLAAGPTAPAATITTTAPVAATTAPGKALSATALDATLRRAGFSGDGLRTAWAVAMRESGAVPDIVSKPNGNGTLDHGLFQINDVHRGSWIDFDRLGQADYNASVAYRMSKGGTDFSAWGLGRTGWAGQLAAKSPATYQNLQEAFQRQYQAYPNAIAA